MTKQTGRKNPVGRPTSYDPKLVRAIIMEGMADGTPAAEIDVPFVKRILCEYHGVSGQIREDSLGKLIVALHKELAEEEWKRLMKGLPDAVVPAVDEVVAAMRQDLLLLVGRQNAACQATADQECEELRVDKRNANWRIAQLESALKEQGAELAAFARARSGERRVSARYGFWIRETRRTDDRRKQ